MKPIKLKTEQLPPYFCSVGLHCTLMRTNTHNNSLSFLDAEHIVSVNNDISKKKCLDG